MGFRKRIYYPSTFHPGQFDEAALVDHVPHAVFPDVLPIRHPEHPATFGVPTDDLLVFGYVFPDVLPVRHPDHMAGASLDAVVQVDETFDIIPIFPDVLPPPRLPTPDVLTVGEFIGLVDHVPHAVFPDVLPPYPPIQPPVYHPGEFDEPSVPVFVEVGTFPDVLYRHPLWGKLLHMEWTFFSSAETVEVRVDQTVTKLDVFNIAALALGFAEGVSDPDENSQPAITLRKRWVTARRSFLEEHPYNGAKRTAVLSKAPTAPVDRWKNMFVLPYDHLRIMSLNGISQSDGTDPWEIEVDIKSNSRVLLTDADEAIVSMIIDVDDLTHLKTKVIEAMGLYLAYQVNEVFPMTPAKRKDLKDKMDHAVSITKGADGQEGTPPRRTQSFVVAAMKQRRRPRGGRRRF